MKGRPTEAQLADRLRPPRPEGMELYLDVSDISGAGWLEGIVDRISRHEVGDGFVWVVEGPLRSLDGEYFDLGRESNADREVINRIVNCAARLGAAGVVIHCIAPVREERDLTEERRRRAMISAERMLEYYVTICREHNVVPTIENIPPVLRMREGAFVFSLIGMAPADLVYFADRLTGLKVTCDTSHAQLYLNALSTKAEDVPADLAAIVAFVQERGKPMSLPEYVHALGDRIFEAHVSNAEGLLGEGLAYDSGVADLDAAAHELLKVADYLVTEPIEPDPNEARLMRQMAERLMAVREQMTQRGDRS